MLCCTKLLSFFLLLQAPASEKLPVMYLMDSIVKNVGREYLTAFTKNLVATFICVFEKVYMLSEKFCILSNIVPGKINTCFQFWVFLGGKP